MSKKCKGNGKAKGWGCGTPLPFTLNSNIKTYKSKYGLGYDCGCFQKFLIGSEEGLKIIKNTSIKAKKETEKQNKKKLKQKKQKLKSIQQLIKEARIPFQKWIRKRDEDKSCVSCGTQKTTIWDAGHYYKAELYSGLIFDEDNVHKQCRKCNSYLGGNEREYKKGLEKRYGKDFVLKLEQKAVNLRSRKYTREELINIKRKYQQKLRNND